MGPRHPPRRSCTDRRLAPEPDYACHVTIDSPNCVKALEWGTKSGLRSVALVGAKRGRMAELAEHALVIQDTHYGRVEDAQMGICHLLCYAFMEHPELVK